MALAHIGTQKSGRRPVFFGGWYFVNGSSYHHESDYICFSHSENVKMIFWWRHLHWPINKMRKSCFSYFEHLLWNRRSCGHKSLYKCSPKGGNKKFFKLCPRNSRSLLRSILNIVSRVNFSSKGFSSESTEQKSIKMHRNVGKELLNYFEIFLGFNTG